MILFLREIRLGNFFLLFSLFCTGLMFYGCNTFPEISRKHVKIVSTSFPVNIFNESGKISDDGKKLLSEIIAEEGKCIHTYVLDPEIVRPDIGLTYSIVTKIDRSGIVATDKPQVVVKYLKQNLDTLVIPENILRQPSSKSSADSSYFKYIQSDDLRGDSVIVFLTNKKAITYEYASKKYVTLSDIDEIRKRIQSILCNNPKATIALLIDPPAQAAKPNRRSGPISASGKPPKPTINKVIAVHREGGHARPIGDLTILKGSEGCDICTRYYSAYDATGHLHEVKEQNSTNCCPCDKTVEIRGRTFVMNCDGSPRLRLVE